MTKLGLVEGTGGSTTSAQSGSYRLGTGGRIDRSRPISFTFDGRQLTGYAGDTVASALLGAGVSLVGRSFKYHRPRGILTAGTAEPNALLTIGTGGRTEPNTRATLAELCPGLVASSQNRWPSLRFDAMSVNGFASRFLGAGFYYKTFMWPASFWERVYEPIIRRAAGLGRATFDADPDHYETTWAHCDLLIVGSGPAGLAAALTAGRAGARVIIADESFELGGSLLSVADSGKLDVGSGLAATILAELGSLPNVRLLPRTTVFGWYDDNVFGALERVQKHVAEPAPDRPVERLWRITAKYSVIATGAEQRPLMFGGNDLPGVMMASAVSTYLNRFAVAAGRRAIVFTSDASGYGTAADLEASGVEVAAIVDPNPAASAPWQGRARVLAGHVVRDTVGGLGLKAAVIANQVTGATETIAADLLAMAGGWSPVVHLACQRGVKPTWSAARAAFLAPETQAGLAMAGAAAGLSSTAACLGDGAAKAASFCHELDFAEARPAFERADDDEGSLEHKPPTAFWHVGRSKKKAFVDFQNDVHLDDLDLARREGYGHVELAKRYTTTGMATDQGKLSNVNVIRILAEARGVSPTEIGTTTFRPFYTPVSFGALAGAHRAERFQPIRRSPLHDWAARRGASFVETGLWYRPAWYPQTGETTWQKSADREARTVRAAVGICDVSTLGKIAVTGRDAAVFLDRIYCNGFLKLPVGKSRYGLMLRDDGFVMDDGTTSRLAEDHFITTTTTAAAGPVLAHMEFCAQVLWPQLDVRLTSITDAWAQIAVAGPKSRAVLQKIVDADLSNDAFPFLAAKAVTLFGDRLEGRLFRISYSGELAYELAVPAGYGGSVADALLAAGAEFGICPYGAEAQGILRIEKGHVTHAEINGTVTPHDVGLGRMVASGKPDFIGKVMGARPALTSTDRPRLVGVKPRDPAATFRNGSHIVPDGAPATTDNDHGYVTSSCFSPHLGHTIGLALVTRGDARHGEHVRIVSPLHGEETDGILCDSVFVDPEGVRVRG